MTSKEVQDLLIAQEEAKRLARIKSRKDWKKRSVPSAIVGEELAKSDYSSDMFGSIYNVSCRPAYQSEKERVNLTMVEILKYALRPLYYKLGESVTIRTEQGSGNGFKMECDGLGLMGNTVFSNLILTVKNRVFIQVSSNQRSRSEIELFRSLLLSDGNEKKFIFEILMSFFDFKVEQGDVCLTGCDETISQIVKILSVNDKKLMNRHVLLAGPPGTGKSMIVKAVVNELKEKMGDNVVFMNVRSGNQRWVDNISLMSELVGGTNIQFIVMIDEIDELGLSRDVNRDTVYQLLRFMDGTSACHNVKVIATTNRPRDLDSALLRTGRFGPVMYVDKPSKSMLEVIYRFYMSKYGGKLNGGSLYCEGVTGADIRCAVEQCMIDEVEMNEENVNANLKSIVSSRNKVEDKMFV